MSAEQSERRMVALADVWQVVWTLTLLLLGAGFGTAVVVVGGPWPWVIYGAIFAGGIFGYAGAKLDYLRGKW